MFVFGLACYANGKSFSGRSYYRLPTAGWKARARAVDSGGGEYRKEQKGINMQIFPFAWDLDVAHIFTHKMKANLPWLFPPPPVQDFPQETGEGEKNKSRKGLGHTLLNFPFCGVAIAPLPEKCKKVQRFEPCASHVWTIIGGCFFFLKSAFCKAAIPAIPLAYFSECVWRRLGSR